MTKKLKITAAHIVYCPPTWVWVNDGVRKYEFNIWLVKKGHGTIEMSEKIFNLQSGDLFLFRHKQTHKAFHDPARPLVVPYIAFEYHDQRGRRIMPDETTLPALHRRVHNLTFVSALLERCIENFKDNRHDQAVAWLEASLLELGRQDEKLVQTELQSRQQKMIDDICEEIRKNLSFPMRVEDISAEHGFSTDHFIRIFKRHKGLTPGEFQIQARIQAASELLRFSTLSVTSIAETFSYSDIYAFSKQFTQRTGKSPTAFRKGI